MPDAAAIRKAAGERAFQALRGDDNPRRVVHFSEWTSHVDARAFFQSPRLEAIRREAGVRAPEFIYLDEADRGVL